MVDRIQKWVVKNGKSVDVFFEEDGTVVVTNFWPGYDGQMMRGWNDSDPAIRESGMSVESAWLAFTETYFYKKGT